MRRKEEREGRGREKERETEYEKRSEQYTPPRKSVQEKLVPLRACTWAVRGLSKQCLSKTAAISLIGHSNAK